MNRACNEFRRHCGRVEAREGCSAQRGALSFSCFFGETCRASGVWVCADFSAKPDPDLCTWMSHYPACDNTSGTHDKR